MEKAGTYAFDTFDDKDKELNRLLEQATVLSELELEMLKKKGLKEGMDVLDAACGPGAISCLLSKSFKNLRVVGADINENLLQKARELADYQNLKIRFQQADIYNLDFKEQFDLVYCRFLFQHLKDPVKALDSINKALRPGGIICIVDIDDRWLTLEPEVPAFNIVSRVAIDK